MSKKEYPLQIRTASDEDGGPDIYWSKGHHDVEAFCAAVRNHMGLDDAPTQPHPSSVGFDWWRHHPAGSEDGSPCWVDGKEGARGSVPVTWWAKDEETRT